MIGWLLLALGCGTAKAEGLVRVESNTFGSVRNSDASRVTVPFYEAAAAAYTNEKKDTEVNLDFSLFADPTMAGSTQAKLYLLDVKFAPIADRMSVHAGRTLDSQHTVGINSVDMVSTDVFFLRKQLSAGAFYGLERRIEAVDALPAARIWGTDLHFHSDDTLPYFLTAKFERRRYPDAANPQETRLELSAQKGLATAWNPELIVDSVTSLDGGNIDRLEGGVNLYPGLNTLIQLREQTYNILPNTGPEQPIFSIISTGRLYESRAQGETKLTKSWTFSLAGYRDQFYIQPGILATGYGAQAENRLQLGTFNVGHTLYVFHSYGGDVLGNRILARKTTFKNNELYALADYAHYSKITSSSRPILNTELGWASVIGKLFKLSLGAEFNSTNYLQYDFRAISKLVYVFWNET
ncbi:MAG: hypothetical protein ACXVCG_06335 [Bdellovibrionota bacterium]